MIKRKQTALNIMVGGSMGLGKTSFINTLLNNHIINITNTKENIINVYSINLPIKHTKQLNIITLPPLNYNINDEDLHLNIENYITQQYNIFLEEETKIKRNSDFKDTRVNLLLYFIGSAGQKESDVVFLKRVSNIVNVIPVIGKSDQITTEEVTKLRKKVKKQALDHEIRFYRFCKDWIIEENKIYAQLAAKNKKKSEEKFDINDIMPFRVVNRSWFLKDEERYVGNIHIDYEKPEISDFLILREIVLSDAADELIDSTHYELYETYREETLSKLIHQ